MQSREDMRYYTTGAVSTTTTGSRVGLLSKVAGLLAFSMVFTAVGAFIGVQAPGLGLPAMIGVLVLALVLGFARNVAGLNLGLLYLLTTLAGVGLGGIISRYLGAGLGGIVLQAAGLTAVMTFGLSAYALTTKRDFSGLGSKLFLAVLGLIAASILGIFLQIPMLHVGIGLAGAVIFSLYLIYEVQQALTVEDTLPNAIMVSVGIYLSIFNLFLSLLRLLTALSGRD